MAPKTTGKGFPMAEKLYVRKGVTSSNLTLEDIEMHVLSGGTAYNTKVRDDGRLIVSKGGLAENTSNFYRGHLVISNGGVASGLTTSSGGNTHVSKGGLVKNVTISSGGWLSLCSGGSASEINVRKSGNLSGEPGAMASYISWTPCEGNLHLNGGVFSFASRMSGVHYGSDNTRISSWTSPVSDKTIPTSGSMCVMHGGSANKITVNYAAHLQIYSGGTASGATLTKGITELYGGVAKDTTLTGGYMFVYNGGIVSGATTTDSGTAMVYSGGTLTNCSGNFYMEVYSGGTVTDLKLTSGGKLRVEKGAKVANVTKEEGATIVLEKGASIKWKGALLPEPSRDCDDGWNNWLYDSRTKERNRFLPASSDGVTLQSGFTGEIKPDDSNPSGASYWNYVGYRDEVDFQKITLNSAARLSFTVSAYGSVKFTLWKLTYNPYKKDAYTLKALQTRTFKGGGGDTASILLEVLDSETEYYISVESTDATKTGGENYKIELNNYMDGQGKPCTWFFADGDNGYNGWLLDAHKNPNTMLVSTTVTGSNQAVKLDSGISKTIAGVSYNGFVGFGDEIDYGKLKVGADAKLTFEVTAKDAAKFTVYELLANGKKKSVLSGKCKKDHNDISGDPVYVYTNTKGVQLKKSGNYYLCVQSTNAKKSAIGTYYSVKVLTYDTSLSSMLNEADFGMNSGLDIPDGSAGDILSGLQDELNFGQNSVENSLTGAASAPDALAASGQSGWQDLAKLA